MLKYFKLPYVRMDMIIPKVLYVIFLSLSLSLSVDSVYIIIIQNNISICILDFITTITHLCALYFVR